MESCPSSPYPLGLLSLSMAEFTFGRNDARLPSGILFSLVGIRKHSSRARSRLEPGTDSLCEGLDRHRVSAGSALSPSDALPGQNRWTQAGTRWGQIRESRVSIQVDSGVPLNTYQQESTREELFRQKVGLALFCHAAARQRFPRYVAENGHGPLNTLRQTNSASESSLSHYYHVMNTCLVSLNPDRLVSGIDSHEMVIKRCYPYLESVQDTS
jgi:hypothetical protein